MIDKLTILWTSGDEDIAINMVFMYVIKSNTNKWWKECNLITWGPSNKLLLQSKELQDLLREAMDLGVKVFACRRCAERYGIVEELEDLNIEVIYMGEPFTEYLKDESCRVITI